MVSNYQRTILLDFYKNSHWYYQSLLLFLLFFILLTTLYNVLFNSLILLDPALSVNTDYNLSVLFSESNNSPNNNMSVNTSDNRTVNGNITLSKENAAELGKGVANAASNIRCFNRRYECSYGTGT